jgi:hypothetical protein
MPDPNASHPPVTRAVTNESAPRNLVFARVGATSLHRHWLAEPKAERSWDLQLSTWSPSLSDLPDGDFPVFFDPSVKWSSVAHYFRERPELMDTYEYVMFPDDDILFDAGSITRLFAVCQEYGLQIAQPALRPSSHLSYALVLECPKFRLRYSNFVEPMCPILRTDHLRVMLRYFERWSTGWGLDEFWTLLMPAPVRAGAIIDCEPVLHLRPHQAGEIYTSFRTLGLDPQQEMNDIASHFTNLPQGKLVYEGISAKGRAIGRIRTNLLNGIHLMRTATAMREPQHAFRCGLGMLARIVTKLHYQPVRVVDREAWPMLPPLTRATSLSHQ